MNRALLPQDRGGRGGTPGGQSGRAGLSVALADWSAELRILQNEQRRRRRPGGA